MAESRAELVAWVNELLGLSYTKIEQMGSGAAYCQIMDSIYGNLQMSRVKFATKHEYEYLDNYKILQNVFTMHKIDKSIPADRLMKCKMQDNLEFLQWLRKYWDQHYPGVAYDATGRRGASNNSAPSANRSTTAASKKHMNDGAPNRSMSSRGANTSTRASADHAIVLSLQKELQGERDTVAALEKERDFYFQKLRDIEVLIQQELEANPDMADDALLKEIQAILYSTEEGFAIPPEDEHGEAHVEEYPDETF